MDSNLGSVVQLTSDRINLAVFESWLISFT